MKQESKSDGRSFINFEMALLACQSLHFYAACLGYLVTSSSYRDVAQCSCTVHLGGMPPFNPPSNYLFSDCTEDEHDYVSDYDGTIQHVHTFTYYFDY